MNDYDKNLYKNKANYVPLTPISFIERTKDIYPNYEAIVYKVGHILGLRFIKDV